MKDGRGMAGECYVMLCYVMLSRHMKDMWLVYCRNPMQHINAVELGYNVMKMIILCRYKRVLL